MDILSQAVLGVQNPIRYDDMSRDGLTFVTYADERAILQQIADGDVKGISKPISQEELEIFKKLPVISDNAQKNMEYMVCASITLGTRAAIIGGVDSRSAYDMANIFLGELAQKHSIADYIALHRKAMVSFAQKVQDVKNSRSEYQYIEQCKNYIANHLNQPFTLNDIAAHLGINRSYLSRKFAKETGTGLWQYVQQERINAAQNMLRFSDFSLDKIAAYLCFSSQSHFGSVFKKYTGMTPKEFQSREKIQDTQI